MALRREIDVFFQHRTHHIGIVTIHQHVDPLLHEGTGDLGCLQCQKAPLAGGIGQFNRFGNQVFQLVALVHEGFARHLESHQELAKVELHHGDEDGAQDGDHDRGDIHIHADRTTQQHAVYDHPESQHYPNQTT